MASRAAFSTRRRDQDPERAPVGPQQLAQQPPGAAGEPDRAARARPPPRRRPGRCRATRWRARRPRSWLTVATGSASAAQQLAVGGTVASRWRCSPTWVMVPSWSSATRSASSTVEARWATTSPVVAAEHPAAAPPRPASRCGRRGRTACRRAPARWAGQHRAGQGQPLALAAGERHPLLADAGCRGPTAGRGRSRPGRSSSASSTSASVASARPSVRFSRALIENRVGSSKAVATSDAQVGRGRGRARRRRRG